MSTIKISELATSNISLSDFFVKADSSGVANKNTIQELSNLLKTVDDTAFKGSIAIADVPTENGWFFASESGTYTNCGGLVIDTTDNIAIIIVSGTFDTFNKIDIPVNITIDAVPTDGSNNAVSSNGVYDAIANASAVVNTGTFSPLDNVLASSQNSTAIYLESNFKKNGEVKSLPVIINFDKTYNYYQFNTAGALTLELGAINYSGNCVAIELGANVTGLSFKWLNIRNTTGTFNASLSAGESNLVYLHFIQKNYIDVVYTTGVSTPEVSTGDVPVTFISYDETYVSSSSGFIQGLGGMAFGELYDARVTSYSPISSDFALKWSRNSQQIASVTLSYDDIQTVTDADYQINMINVAAILLYEFGSQTHYSPTDGVYSSNLELRCVSNVLSYYRNGVLIASFPTVKENKRMIIKFWIGYQSIQLSSVTLQSNEGI